MIERAPCKPSSKIQEEEAYLVRSAMAIVISNRSAMTGVVWGKELGADGGKELGAVMGRQWCATRGEEPARRGHAVKRRLLGEREGLKEGGDAKDVGVRTELPRGVTKKGWP